MPNVFSDATLSAEALTAAYEVAGPVLRTNFVVSLDGTVAVRDPENPQGHLRSGPLGNRADLRVLGHLRGVCDALMVGAGTLRQEGYGPLVLDKPRRARRRAAGQPDYPTLVVVSNRGTDLATHRALVDAPTRPIVVTSAANPYRAELEPVADVVVAGDSRVDLSDAVGKLRARGFAHVLCEGGPMLLTGLLAADLVDEMCLTLSAQLSGAPIVPMHSARLPRPQYMHLQHAIRVDDTLLLRYARDRLGQTR